jgi:adenylosuccinate lyase
MGRIWTEENKLAKRLEVELLACEALAERGEVPREAVTLLRKNAKVNVARMQEIEAQTKHDVIAFVSSVAETVGTEGRFLHLGLTSSDVIDTGFAVQLCEATDLLLQDIDAQLVVLKRMAEAHANTPMIGRTHGVHAEPITFGLKAAHWYAEMKRNRARLTQAREEIAFGKISGAVGAFANIEPEVEAFVCARLGLKAEPVSTQIVPRDRHAVFFSTLALIGSSLERIATEVRHLQRTEVFEVKGSFTPGKRDLRLMAHKRNSGNWRMSRYGATTARYALAAFENVPLWHERDISHSSVERVIGPDAPSLDLRCTFNSILDKLVVHPERMRRTWSCSAKPFTRAFALALIRRHHATRPKVGAT